MLMLNQKKAQHFTMGEWRLEEEEEEIRVKQIPLFRESVIHQKVTWLEKIGHNEATNLIWFWDLKKKHLKVLV